PCMRNFILSYLLAPLRVYLVPQPPRRHPVWDWDRVRAVVFGYQLDAPQLPHVLWSDKFQFLFFAGFVIDPDHFQASATRTAPVERIHVVVSRTSRDAKELAEESFAAASA